MRTKVTALLVAGLAVLAVMTACKTPDTVPGKHRPTPVPVGQVHHGRIIVQTTLSDGSIISLPVHMVADVTIVDGEHGISTRTGVGIPYPDRWDAHTSAAHTAATSQLEATYNSDSNPTRFSVIATLQAKDVAKMAPHLTILLKCFAYKDDRLIHVLDEDSHVWETISVEQAKNGAVKSIGVACNWTDNS